MGKYITLQTNIFTIFGSQEWNAENIKTVPTNFTGTDFSEEFIRISIIPSERGLNRDSLSGILIADIFTKAGDGPTRAFTLADKLDIYVQNKFITVGTGVAVQFFSSTFRTDTLDSDNPSLFRSTYTIPFNYTEVV